MQYVLQQIVARVPEYNMFQVEKTIVTLFTKAEAKAKAKAKGRKAKGSI